MKKWVLGNQLARPRRHSHRAHVSEATWNLVAWKRFHFRRLQQVRRLQRVGFLRAMFEQWDSLRPRSRRTQSRCDLTFAPWLRVCDQTVAWHERGYRIYAAMVVKGLRADDRAYFDDVRARQGAAADEGCAGEWKAIKYLLPRQVKKRQCASHCVGPPTAALAKHFCGIEAGHEMLYSDLAEQCIERQRLAAIDAPLVLKLEDLPTRCEVEQVLRAVKPHRAPGLDKVSIDDVKRCAAFDSRPFFHLYSNPSYSQQNLASTRVDSCMPLASVVAPCL